MADNTTKQSNSESFKIATEALRTATSVGGIYSAKESMLFAGPPRFSMIQGNMLYPIASVDVIRIDQQATINSSAGIGSPLITWNGRPSVAAGFGRTVFNIPSLMRTLYAYYPTTIASMVNLTEYHITEVAKGISFPQLTDTQIENLPGVQNLAFNLSSELQNYPFGLLVVFRTQNLNPVNNVGYFLSEARIRAHSIQIAGPSTLVSEEVSVVASSFHPVELSGSSQ